MRRCFIFAAGTFYGLRERPGDPGDFIIAADGEPVTCSDDLLRIKNRHQIGDALTLRVRLNEPHEGEAWPEKEVTVKLVSAADLADSSESEAERGLP